MCILAERCISKDVYYFLTFDEQKEILNLLGKTPKDYDSDIKSGLIIVRWHNDSSERRWLYSSIQIIDKSKINL